MKIMMIGSVMFLMNLNLFAQDVASPEDGPSSVLKRIEKIYGQDLTVSERESVKGLISGHEKRIKAWLKLNELPFFDSEKKQAVRFLVMFAPKLGEEFFFSAEEAEKYMRLNPHRKEIVRLSSVPLGITISSRDDANREEIIHDRRQYDDVVD